MCWETWEYLTGYRSGFVHIRVGNEPNISNYPTHIFTSMRKNCIFCHNQLIEKLPHCLFLSPSDFRWSPTHPPFCLLHTPLLLSSSHHLPLSLTNTAWRAGLPVVSIFHLDAGDSALPLQFISWITREGHRVAGLPPFPIAAAIHRNTWISASCSKWTWRTNTQHTDTLEHQCMLSTGNQWAINQWTNKHTHTVLYHTVDSCQAETVAQTELEHRADCKLISVKILPCSPQPQLWSSPEQLQWSTKIWWILQIFPSRQTLLRVLTQLSILQCDVALSCPFSENTNKFIKMTSNKIVHKKLIWHLQVMAIMAYMMSWTDDIHSTITY